ncbi:MAG: alanine racemase [Firmicutes bacterium]|nr:alanine racemase [Bacillota bacterium]
MREMIRRSWAEIDLDAAAHNMRGIRRVTSPNAKVLATVKANAYGNGVYEMSKVFLENGADMLAVATLEEGEELRGLGIDAPVLILGTCMEDMLEGLVDRGITPNIYSYDRAKRLSEIAVKKGKIVKIHIKLDTGMGRIGYTVGEDNAEVIDEILKISELKNIEIEGIFSHFSTSDEADSAYTKLQFKRFMSVCSALEERGLHIPVRHICNSAGIMMYPEMHLDMVRAGIISYGMYPSDEVDKTVIDLIPVMTLKSRITHIKTTESNRGISYGKEYITEAPTKIATVPIGYADGYLRGIANGGRIMAGGTPVPILGRICMDQCMIDVTNVHNINIGDEVILFGREGVTIDDVARWLHTINYEVSCCISRRIPRVYIKNGKEVNITGYPV